MDFNADRFAELIESCEDAIAPDGNPEVAAAIAAQFLAEFDCEIEFCL